MEFEVQPKNGESVLGLTKSDLTLLLIGFPLLGGALGAAAPWVADIAAGLSWIPSNTAVDFVADMNRGLSVGILAAVGLVAGLVFALFAIGEMPKVTVSDSVVLLELRGDERTVMRADVHCVFVDGKKLVLLDNESRHLIREDVEGGAAAAKKVFRRHKYPWADHDPFEDMFRRWIPNAPELTPSVNALLKVREKALEKKSADDVAEFAENVAQLGYVVRDKGTAQYWRPLVREPR